MPAIHHYFLTHDNIFICTNEDGQLNYIDRCGNSEIIAESVCPAGDSIYDKYGTMHFVVQDASGSLIYLKSDGNKWTKFELYKSRNRLTSIRQIRLCTGKELLCAFYIMEHRHSNLLVMHRFNSDNPYIEPSVIDCTDARQDFCICTTSDTIMLFYRNIYGEYIERCYDMKFRELTHRTVIYTNDVFCLRVVSDAQKLHTVRTEYKNGYTSLIYAPYKDPEKGKNLTFGIRKNLIPCINCFDGKIIIQWNDDGTIMQSLSNDCGKTFYPPYRLRPGQQLCKIRISGLNAGQHTDMCAAFKKEISICDFLKSCIQSISYEGGNKMPYYDNYRDFKTTTFFLQKLDEIEKYVSGIESKLDVLCKFLDNISEFKKETASDDIYIRPINELKQESKTMPGNDIGERNEENIKIFENMELKDDDYE